MNFLHVALLSAAGLTSTAAAALPASADEIGFGISLGGHHGTRGFVDLHLGSPRARYATYQPVGPMYYSSGGYHAVPVATYPEVQSDLRQVWIPAMTTYREQVVIDPPVYESRVVPVFDVRTVPRFDLRFDARHRRMVRVQVGLSTERVQVGTRVERVLVFAGGSHVVRVPETIPGHFVWVGVEAGHRRHLQNGEQFMTEAEYQALMQNAEAFSANR